MEKHLEGAIEQKNFDVTPKVINPSEMKPSIETMLHAVMSQKIVVHLHPVNVVAWLVRKNCPIENLPKGHFTCTLVNYHKPGPNLARAVHSKINHCPEIDVVFLKNHGVIVGGDNVDTVFPYHKKILMIFSIKKPRPQVNIPLLCPHPQIGDTALLPVKKIQQLVFDDGLFSEYPRIGQFTPTMSSF